MDVAIVLWYQAGKTAMGAVTAYGTVNRQAGAASGDIA